MDLVQTVRKEGSRGGVNFSWDDVKNSQHRENYLGHSVMAPVGRWQKNKDLSWYARAEDADLTPEQRAEKEQERKREEMRKIKEAEEDAMLKAMGLPVPDRTNANQEPLGMGKEKQREMNQALKEALGDDEDGEVEKGVGLGGKGGVAEAQGRRTMAGGDTGVETGRGDGVITTMMTGLPKGGSDQGQDHGIGIGRDDTGAIVPANVRGQDLVRGRRIDEGGHGVAIGHDTKRTRRDDETESAIEKTGHEVGKEITDDGRGAGPDRGLLMDGEGTAMIDELACCPV
ncbi:uncharacterized protein LTR77_003145 [Saxophila tyrrhenica]|uniref:Multiple myeloma tumor-associated protein 2-like N-terminal domain-containing protein n=1 Tax=Saxophila tyrrhenica TaxID=1690608 RepID=A0AAV9PIA8_9PEZI|nr:hypothetical protein LTR77_003145 [Saxophila tyrrhenica]